MDNHSSFPAHVLFTCLAVHRTLSDFPPPSLTIPCSPLCFSSVFLTSKHWSALEINPRTLSLFYLDPFLFSSVQSLSRVRLFATPWITARQASLSITISQSSPKLTSIMSVMPSSHLILCWPLLLLPPIPPNIRVFSNESALHMSCPSTGVSALASVLPKNT